MDKLAALRKLAFEGGIPIHPPAKAAQPPQREGAKAPEMTEEEWLRFGREMGYGGASNNAPAKPAESGRLGDDKWSRIMNRFKQSRLFPNGSHRPISGGDVRPSWNSQLRFPELVWKDGDPIPEGYRVVEQMTYPPKRFIVPKPKAL